MSSESALLCESCGYPVGGIDRSGKCPECGRDVRDSLPEKRTGSAWQTAPGLASLVRTNLRALAAPSRTFDVVTIETDLSRWLERVNVAIGSVLLALGVGVFLGLRHEPAGPVEVRLWGVVAVLTPVCFGLMRVLTAIERVGIRTAGRLRGWRVTPAVATSVCAHATAGWALAGALAFAVSIAIAPKWSPVMPVVDRLTMLHWHLARVGAIFGAWVLGMLVFETLVWAGLRRCKFANAPGVRSDHAGTTPDSTGPRR